MSGSRKKALKREFPVLSISEFRFIKKHRCTRAHRALDRMAENRRNRERVERNNLNNERIAAIRKGLLAQ